MRVQKDRSSESLYTTHTCIRQLNPGQHWVEEPSKLTKLVSDSTLRRHVYTSSSSVFEHNDCKVGL